MKKIWRSEKHRRTVAKVRCLSCGIEGYSQAAHINYGKGFGLKVSDALVFPLCCDRPGVNGCHSLHDSGAIHTKGGRARAELSYLFEIRRILMEAGEWEIEDQFQSDVEPLRNYIQAAQRD